MILPKIKWSMVNYVKLLLPMFMGYLTSSVCWDKTNSKRAGQSVSFRPPAKVFGIVWPILYVLLGLSWIISTANARGTMIDFSFVLIIVFLTSWIIVYGCNKNKIGGVYVIACSMGSVILAMNMAPLEARLMLVPLLTWLMLALLLNAFEVY